MKIQIKVINDAGEEVKLPTDQLKKFILDEITEFETWFQSRANSLLISLERAILATYLFHKISGT